MGFYIQTPESKGKAEYLIETYGAELLPDAPTWQDERAIICVVDNGPFEAAGYAFSPDELAQFKRRDMGVQRPRKWLLMDKETVHKLTGFGKSPSHRPTERNCE